jgi:UbiD family decarboxylase
MKDLREFIQKAKEVGELKVIEGANWELEIGAISFEVASRPNPSALLFDKIPGYKPGFRILTIPCSTDKRLALTLELPVELTRLELVRKLRDKLNEPLKLIPPVEVKEGPILENIYTGDKVDLYMFPSLQWTSKDGGRYIGTGDNVIVRDPEEGWVNVSTNRIQIHDKATATIFCEPGQHLAKIREKYWSQGENCPVVVTCGGDPLLVSISGTRIPWGMSEYDYAGWWKKEPLKVIKGPTTGLPIPAYAEIALEGEISPLSVETIQEGPFTEFTGHYSPEGPESVFRVKRILHRNDPILLGAITYLGPGIPAWTRGPIMSAQIWGQLDKIVPEVKGVWSPDEFGLERCLVISLKQLYPGHAKHAALVALGHYPMSRKYVIVVDEDVDPSNIREVLFALGHRADPEALDLIRGNWTSKLDPLLANPEKKRINDITCSTLIILACKPYSWIEQFPPPIRIPADLQENVRKKWGSVLDSI